MFQIVIRIKQGVWIPAFSSTMIQIMHQRVDAAFSNPGVLRQVVLRIEQKIWVPSVFRADREIVRNRVDVACYTVPRILKVLRVP